MPDVGELVRATTDPDSDTVATNESTTTTTYTNLTTGGPTVTVSLRDNQMALVIIEAHLSVDVSGVNGAFASFEIAGPGSSDLAVADANGLETGNIKWTPGTRTYLFTATEEGAHVFTMKYRVAGAVTGSFKNRQITVIPLP